MSRRAFVVVADACGAGELPDAGEYGDSGSNTLGHLAQSVLRWLAGREAPELPGRTFA